MIEIIREEDWDRTTKALPKDIKQIGRPDIGDRIYVEDQVYRFLHPYESQDEKMAYVLLGRFENYAGKQCTFIEAAIRLEEVAFEGELPLWDDNTWAYIYKQLKHEYDSMVIVGWAMDIKGLLPNLTARIEALHYSNFGGAHQLLLLLDTLEGEEAFYGSRNGHLYQREGFYVYYDKKIPDHLNRTMRTLQKENRKTVSEELREETLAGTLLSKENRTEELEEADEFYKGKINLENLFGGEEKGQEFHRSQLYEGETHREAASLTDEPDIPEQEEETEKAFAIEEETIKKEELEEREAEESAFVLLQKRLRERVGRKEEAPTGASRGQGGSYRQQMLEKEEKQPAPSYASSFLLLTVVCVLGVTAYMNYQKMNAMEMTIAQMNGSKGVTEQAAETENGTVKIEAVEGNVQKQETQPETPDAAGDAQQISAEGQAETPDTSLDAAGQSIPDEGTGDGTTPAPTPDAGTGDGTAQTTDGTQSGTAPASDAGTAPAPEASGQAADPAMTEAQTYLSQGYYIVQKGDSLVGICRKIYQTTAMMDKLCEVNGIENQDAIFAGQYLTLPN